MDKNGNTCSDIEATAGVLTRTANVCGDCTHPYRVLTQIFKWSVQNAISMKMEGPVPIFSIVKSQILWCPKSE